MSKNGRSKQRDEVSHLIDAETEALVLGGILNGGDAALREIAFLSVDDFARERNRIIFRAISEIADDVAVGLTAVSCRLLDTGKLEAVGGLAALSDIEARAIPNLSLVRFAIKLREKSRDRRAWRLGAKLSALCEQGFTANSSEVLAVTEELRAVAENSDWKTTGGVHSIRPVRDYGDAKAQPVVDDILYAGTVNILSGEASHGKSTLATALAATVAAGSPFLGKTTSRRPVLILDRENANWIITERLDRLDAHDGDGLTIWGGWCTSEPPGPDHPEVLSWVRGCEPKPLIIFDSLIAFFDGQSENDSAEMRRFMQRFRRLANAGCTILLIHHSGRGEHNKDYRGSSDIKAAIDSGLSVFNYGETRLERMRVKSWKTRFGTGIDMTVHYSDGLFAPESTPPIRTTKERFIELLKENPGVKICDFEKLARRNNLSRDAARKFLNNGVDNKTIELELGNRNVHMHKWVGSSDGSGS